VPKRARRILSAVGIGVAAAALFPTLAFAQEADPVVVLGQQINLLWIIIGAALVVFMQAGFALVETGFCRAKHAAHVVSTNFAVFGLGFIGFFFIGFPLAFGGFSYGTAADSWSFGLFEPVGGPLLGSGSWVFLWEGGWALSGAGITPALIGFFLYMVAFMDTVATM
jgi:Amt family ammonium transporter